MRWRGLIALVLCGAVLFSADVAYSQITPADIPGAVDPGRILDNKRNVPDTPKTDAPFSILDNNVTIAPPGSENLLFTLNSVSIEGMSVYTKDHFNHAFNDKIGQMISANFIWELAAEITKTYKDDEYFLSRAIVPAQTIEIGDIRIVVIEGHIDSINVAGDNKEDSVIQAIVKDIIAQKPTKIKHLESNLLRLGDLHGVSYDAVLRKKRGGTEGSVTLALQPKEPEKARVTIGTNNYSSRFSGPYRANMTFEHSPLDYHKTTFAGLLDMPRGNELALATLNHRVQVTPSVELDFLISSSCSHPGSSLSQSNIDSNSFAWELGARWLTIRQRNENLTLFAKLNALNSNVNTFSVPLTRDRVRALRVGGTYDFIDQFSGFNTINFTLSRGLSGLGASSQNNPNSSRSDASPDFTKIEASYNRQDYLDNNILLNLNVNGQIASRGLYSSEEFGFGGINAGRAYDFSEIIGDHGISALAELQYTDFGPIKGYQFRPLIFYDFGKVWNEGNAAIKNVSASSAGFGARVYNEKGLNFDTTLAFPLTKPIDNPLYGNEKNPVLRFGLTYQFDVEIPIF